jgi:hypothetical protein
VKYDRNVVPNDFSVGLIMPFIYPNISQGKVNVTINHGPEACPVFEKHESSSQNRRRKEEEEEEKKRAAAAQKDKHLWSQEKEGRELIAANKTRRAPVLLDAKKKKKNVSPGTKFYLKLRSV